MEKVSWAKKVQSRPCEEFQAWLVRGNFQEGDDCDWKEAARKEKLLEKWRRRGDLEWQLGRSQPAPASPFLDLPAPDSPSWSQEEEEEEELGWRSPVRGEREELGGLESDSSGQSLVTHIRTPPRITIMEEQEELEQDEDKDTIRTPEMVEEWPGPVKLSSMVRSQVKRLKLC